MIIDTLEQASRYYGICTGFQTAFVYLCTHDLRNILPGTYEIDGRRVYVIVSECQAKGRADASPEAHRNYIDIQTTLSGKDLIGFIPLRDCRRLHVAYSADKDCEFYSDEPRSWLEVPEGVFAVFFPQDAHAPLAGEGVVKKAVFKIRV